ncbi:ankyrin repeat-containing domain protein [Mycena olivaceomarginata]|nr:ankyrin repeat-containing domain protein [Mycena olivaceomarginata]
MALLSDLPPELVLHIVSFLTRAMIIDPECRILGYTTTRCVPDLPSISALSRTCTVFYHALDQHLYYLCASAGPLGKLALLFAVEHQLESAVDKLFLAGISLDTEFVFESDRCNLLQIAAALGLRAMVVKLLAMYGEENMMAKVLARGETTPLDYAVRNGHMEIVKLLAPIPRSSVAPPQGSGMRQQYLGDALIASVIAGNLEISQCLIMEGADVNFVGDHSYASPIFHAAGAGDLGVVQLLLASGADPNLQTRNGSRPLFNAANLDVARALITAGADIHATDLRSRNVLPYFAGKNVEISRLFLERGVDPNLEDELRETPLHYACSMNNAESARGAR